MSDNITDVNNEEGIVPEQDTDGQENTENGESEEKSFLSTGHFSIYQQPDDTDIFHGE